MITEFAQADDERFYMSIDELAEQVKAQADRLFPNRTDTSMYLKMFKELGEMIEDGDPDEVADVFIMLLDFAKRKNIHIAEVVLRKMDINNGRTWVVNELGVMRHV
jgi:hypothetical protein